MVKKLIIFLVLPLWVLAGEFQATVSSNQVGVGESFILELTLADGSAKSAPAVEILNEAFSILSKQQSSHTSIFNGQFSSSTIWKYTLIAQREGEAIIPSISIETSEGVLNSSPITIQVAKNSAESENQGLTLLTDVSNAKPYKNEPFIYTVKLRANKNLANIQMHKFSVEDAIVETHGKPKMYEGVIDGLKIVVVEFSYLLTPLKAGSLKIPSTSIQGGIPLVKKARRSIFDDVFDQYQPFMLTTEELVVDVQPALAMAPWLPARALKIEEIWPENQQFRTGDPITRTLKISATGLKSSQLPSLYELQQQDRSFKIYADKPELGDDDALTSYRKEQHTIIPQQAGHITLPEISITWWDTVNKAQAVATIPARTIEVQAVPEMVPTPQVETVTIVQTSSTLYYVIGGLSLLTCLAIGWVIALQKKIQRLTKAPVKKTAPAPKKEKGEKLPDLNPT